MKYFLFITHHDIEPEVMGPFDSEEERDASAKKFREEEGDEHGIFALDIDFASGKVETWAYSGAFFDEEEGG